MVTLIVVFVLAALGIMGVIIFKGKIARLTSAAVTCGSISGLLIKTVVSDGFSQNYLAAGLAFAMITLCIIWLIIDNLSNRGVMRVTKHFVKPETPNEKEKEE